MTFWFSKPCFTPWQGNFWPHKDHVWNISTSKLVGASKSSRLASLGLKSMFMGYFNFGKHVLDHGRAMFWPCKCHVCAKVARATNFKEQCFFSLGDMSMGSYDFQNNVLDHAQVICGPYECQFLGYIYIYTSYGFPIFKTGYFRYNEHFNGAS